MTKRPDHDRLQPTLSEQENDREKNINSRIETFIRRAQKVNEGNCGIICLLDIKKIPELQDSQKELEKEGFSFEGRQAIKILKVYTPGAGAREFQMLKLAYKIIEESSDKTNLAGVPKPILFKDLVVSPETQKILQSRGLQTALGRIEVLIMDFIPADDLKTFLFREAVKRLPQFKNREQDVETYDFLSLQRILDQELDFIAVPPDSKDPEADGERVSEMNDQKVDKLLKKQGFIIDPSIEKQIRATMKLFHEHDFYFRDGHRRNFLIDKKDNGQFRVYIIDYGNSTVSSGEPESQIYSEEVAPGIFKKFSSDFKVADNLRDLSLNIQEEPRLSKIERELNKLKMTFSKDREWQKYLKQMRNKSQKDALDLEKLLSDLNSRPASLPARPLEFFATLILQLIDEKEITPALVKRFLGSRIPKTIGQTKNFLQNLSDILS